MKGFKNIGNTCYINSGLQMLIQNQDLCQLIINYSSGSEILRKIADFIEKYYEKSESNIIVPIEIKQIVENKTNIFNGFQQQDSTEFIIVLLNIIDEEIKNINKDSKELNYLFEIKFNTRIKCKLRECLQIYNRKEFNNFLFLDIDSDCTSLEYAYKKFKSGTKLENDNKYFCENCQSKRIASKRYSIDIWPKYVNIWLKRFRYNDNKILTKNNQELDIPLIWRHNTYLQGAVIHYGTLNNGHYVYVGKYDSKWYLFNDSSISEIKTEVELKKILLNAYLLSYTRDNL
jgi:ubiquitin C-terminal hydrolase